MAGGYWAVPGGKFEKGGFLQSCKELVESKDV
jgi:ADP-ribose pyrophosphatase YjhB (NUDIX family)